MAAFLEITAPGAVHVRRVVEPLDRGRMMLRIAPRAGSRPVRRYRAPPEPAGPPTG